MKRRRLSNTVYLPQKLEVIKNPLRCKKCRYQRNCNAEFIGKDNLKQLTDISIVSGNMTFMQRGGKKSGTWSYLLLQLLARSNFLQILAKLPNQRLPTKLLELWFWKDTEKYREV